MKVRHATTGATLILVVLFTLLLLAVVLAATMRLGLASRQNTGDQKAILSAQYVAESRISLAQSKLRDLQKLLSNTQVYNASTQKKEDVIRIPSNTTIKQIQEYAARFCGRDNYADVNWTNGSAFSPLKSDKTKEYPNALKCDADANSNLDTQFSVLMAAINPSAYQFLEQAERPRNVDDPASRLTFWNDLMRKNVNSLATDDLKLKLKPLRVVHLSPDYRFRFYVAIDNLASRGVDGGSTRVITAKSDTNAGIWWFELTLPNLSKDVLRTNHHRSYAAKDQATPTVNFDRQVFEGSVHTNEKFLFTSDSTARFKGAVTSAGCTDLPDNTPQDMQCSQTPGVYEAGELITSTNSTKAGQNTEIRNGLSSSILFDSNADGLENESDTKPDFTAGYVPMPFNALSQSNAAKGKDVDGNSLPGNQMGITIDPDFPGVTMFAGGSNEMPLTQYKDGKWAEPSPVYQYISTYAVKENQSKCEYGMNWERDDFWNGRRYSPGTRYNSWPSNMKTTDTEGWYTRYYVKPKKCFSTYDKSTLGKQYRIDSNGYLYEKGASGWPTTSTTKFSGVIFGDSIKKLSGPDRVANTINDTTVDQAPPAIASFAQINVSAQNDINISSDLTYSNTPCKYLETSCNKEPKNILGIFSQSGNITIKKDAPNDINIHSAVLASEGEMNVEGHNYGTNRGDVNLIGGLTENWYGIFGIVGTTTPGYGRNFSYDKRLQQGMSPPFWPVSPKWTTVDATNEAGLDRVVTTQGQYSDF